MQIKLGRSACKFAMVGKRVKENRQKQKIIFFVRMKPMFKNKVR